MNNEEETCAPGRCTRAMTDWQVGSKTDSQIARDILCSAQGDGRVGKELTARIKLRGIIHAPASLKTAPS